MQSNLRIMIHSYYTVLLTLLMSMVGVKASAVKVEIGGIWYILVEDNHTAIVTYSGYPYNNDYTGHYHESSSLKGKNIQIPPTVLYNDAEYTVTAIGNYAFYDCESSILMSSITIPSTVTSIGNCAFRCTALTSFIIPSSVTSIGTSAFGYCTGLTSITIEKETPITLTENLVGNPTNVTLYVPSGCAEEYRNASYWSNFTDIREMDPPSSVSITMATASGAERSMIGYSSRYGLDFTGVSDVKAYSAVAFTKDYVTYLSRIYVVPPYTGVVLRTETPGITVDIPTTGEDVYMANLLQPAVSNTTINPTETIEGVEYGNLMVGKISGTETMGFVKFNTPVVRSNNCYLRVPLNFYNSLASAPQQNGLTFVFDDNETADIRSINESVSSADDKVYDLQGRPVTTTKKGLVIKNGKLIFIKP